MKVIFLDFDGVLNNERTFQENIQIDPYCAKLIIDVCEKCNLKIVISSSWRAFGREYIEEKMLKAGCSEFSKYIHSDWKTPRIRGKRGKEIKAWLKNHPEVTQYLCIDDDSDFFPKQPLLSINTLIGLTKIDQLAIEFFFINNSEDDKWLFGNFKQQARIANHNLKLLEKKWTSL